MSDFRDELSAFYKRLQGKERIKISTGGPNFLDTAPTEQERKTRQKIWQLNQHVRIKSANRRYLQYFDEYRQMDITYPIVKAALDIYAEETVNKDVNGELIKIVTKNEKVKKLLEDCFFENLNINKRAFVIAREFCKFGNVFAYLITRQDDGVVDLVFLPPDALVRQQMIDLSAYEGQMNFEKINEYKFLWNGSGGGGTEFEPWEIVHWKNTEDLESEPYGVSILRPIVETWRRVILMREALIVYRITRAPQRYLFKIATDGLTGEEAYRFAQDVKKEIKKKPIIDSRTGQLDFKHNPMSVMDDFFIPVGMQNNSDVTTLDGASNLGDIEDYAIIKSDLFAGLKIPKAYLTFEEELSNKAALCLNPLTSIELLDGRSLNLFEVEKELNDGCNLWTYTYDKEKDLIIPSKIKWCRETKKDAKQLRVWLDNDQYIDCTPDHRFILKGGEECQAQDLKSEVSLQAGYSKLNKTYNLKVSKVEELEVVSNMYDLEVENSNHNFLTTAGVFVHNCEEDARFSKTIQRIQTEFIQGLVHIGIVHLFLNGCSTEEIQSFSIEMAHSSTIAEQSKWELMNAKIDVAAKLWDEGKSGLNFMTFAQVLKMVFKLTDEEIEDSIKKQFIEKKINWRLGKLKEEGFYDSPDIDLLADKLRGLTPSKDISTKDLDMFKTLQFENSKSAIEKKIDEELKDLFKKPSVSPSKEVIKRCKGVLTENFEKIKKDLGKL